jgi:hypothetical protein
MTGPARHRYRYAAVAQRTLDDVHGLGPEALEAAVRAVLLVVPARVVGRRVAVELAELARLPEPPEGGGDQAL